MTSTHSGALSSKRGWIALIGALMLTAGLLSVAWETAKLSTQDRYLASLIQCVEFQQSESGLPLGPSRSIAMVRCEVEYGNSTRAVITAKRPSDFGSYVEGKQRVPVRVSRLAPQDSDFDLYPIDFQQRFGAKGLLLLGGFFLTVFAKNPMQSRPLTGGSY